MARKDMETLEKKTLVRFYLPVKYELAIERYMSKKNISKGEAISEFLMGSKTLQEEVKRVMEFYNY